MGSSGPVERPALALCMRMTEELRRLALAGAQAWKQLTRSSASVRLAGTLLELAVAVAVVAVAAVAAAGVVAVAVAAVGAAAAGPAAVAAGWKRGEMGEYS